MYHLFTKLKYKLFAVEWQFTSVINLFPYVAIVTSIAILWGVVTTIIGFNKDQSVHRGVLLDRHLERISSSATLADASKIIIKRNIFNIAGTIPEPNENSFASCVSTPKKTSLPYKIAGIIYGGTSATSLVVFEGNPDENNVYRTNDLLPQGGEVAAIEKDRILIRSKNCPEYLEIENPKPPMSRRGGKNAQTAHGYSENGFERKGYDTVVTKQWLDNLVNDNFNQALEQVKAVPNIVDGQIHGFTLSQIDPSSLYDKLGLQNGDVVAAINGIDLNDAARAIQTLNSLRNTTNFDVKVVRNGQPLKFTVNVQ